MSSWREVRVFISSTFRDMHSERDWLIKRVFPELRDRLSMYKIHLVDIDLRWGVTEEESNNDKVLNLCLEQIDQCRPFFVGILGERYGWVPESFDAKALSKFGWIEEHTKKSVTELEILYGVLNDEEMRLQSYFYFRDPRFTSDVPPSKQPEMLSEDVESGNKLADLKARIEQADLGAPLMKNYPCAYDGLSINWRLAKRELDEEVWESLHDVAEDGLVDPEEYAGLSNNLQTIVDGCSTVRLSGLRDFGERVLKDLWEGIKELYELPDEPPTESLREVDSLAEERDYNDQFEEQRRRVFVGRKTFLDQLHAFVDNGDEIPCVVVAPAGTGKSALLAKFCEEYRQNRPNDFLLSHFVGASPRSTNLREMLRRLCEELLARFNFTRIIKRGGQKEEVVPEEIPVDLSELVQCFKDFVHRIPSDQHNAIVIDALDQLDETDDAHALNWLPHEWPSHVDCITSCVAKPDAPNLPVLDAFNGRTCCTIRLEDLTNQERLEIVTEVPLISAKTLDPKQVELLLSNSATRNPLFLLVALEELRGFGSYEHLNARILDFPKEGDTVTAIFDQVIDRLEDEFNGEQVRSVLSWLACSRHGLSDDELLELLEGLDGITADTDLYPILRQLRRYLQRRSDLNDFHHAGLRVATERRYLFNPDELVIRHKELATYFQAKGYENVHAVSELSYHLSMAKRSQELERTLTDYSFLETKLMCFGARALITDFTYLPLEPDSTLEIIHKSLELSEHILGQDPMQLPSQLYGRLMNHESPLIRKLLAEARPKERAWLRPLMPNLDVPGGPLLRTIQCEYGKYTNSQALSPDGRTLVTVSSKTTIRFIDLRSGSTTKTLQGHTGDICCVTLTPDGRYLASSSEDKSIRIWDVDTGRNVYSMKDLDLAATGIVIMDDSCEVVFCTDRQEVKIWKPKLDNKIDSLAKYSEQVSSINLSSDGQLVSIRRGRSSDVDVWDMHKRQIIRTIKGPIFNFSVSKTPSGYRGIASSWGKDITVWDLASGSEINKFTGHEDGVTHITVSPTSDFVVSIGRNRKLFMWDLVTGNVIRTLVLNIENVDSFSMSSDGLIAVTTSGRGNLCVWNLDSKVAKSNHVGHPAAVNAIVCTYDGRSFISASSDMTLAVWDVKTRERTNSFESMGGITSVSITNDTRLAVLANGGDSIEVWDLEAGSFRNLLGEHEDEVTVVAITPDGRKAVSASYDGGMIIWDINAAKELHRLDAHLYRISGLAIFPDGQTIVSADSVSLKFWDINSGLERPRDYLSMGPVGSESLAISDDGSTMFTGSYDGVLTQCDPQSGAPCKEFIGHADKVSSITITTDCRYALSASSDNSLRVWDIESGKCLTSFVSSHEVRCCSYTPQYGGVVAAGDSSGKIYFLQLELPENCGVFNGARALNVEMALPSTKRSESTPLGKDAAKVQKNGLGHKIGEGLVVFFCLILVSIVHNFGDWLSTIKVLWIIGEPIAFVSGIIEFLLKCLLLFYVISILYSGLKVNARNLND